LMYRHPMRLLRRIGYEPQTIRVDGVDGQEGADLAQCRRRRAPGARWMGPKSKIEDCGCGAPGPQK